MNKEYIELSSPLQHPKQLQGYVPLLGRVRTFKGRLFAEVLEWKYYGHDRLRELDNE